MTNQPLEALGCKRKKQEHGGQWKQLQKSEGVFRAGTARLRVQTAVTEQAEARELHVHPLGEVFVLEEAVGKG